MANVTEAIFALTQTTTYPSLLESPTTVTRREYMEAFNHLPPDFRLPWTEDAGYSHWSSFWGFYIGGESHGPATFWNPNADAAFEYVIPFRWVPKCTIEGPANADADVDADAEVLLYPTGLTVAIRVKVGGVWPLDAVASALADIRQSKEWTLTTPAGSVSSNRTLDGIAQTLRDEAASVLFDIPNGVVGSRVIFTVSTPTAGEGEAASFDLADKTASSCLAGLASLGPAGTLVARNLIDENSDSRHGSRIYVLPRGHAIWNSRDLLDPPDDDPIACLHGNQTHLVGHIAALAGVASWAHDQIKAHVPIAQDAHPLILRAALRLDQLHTGDRAKTYRSEVAKRRIEPFLEALQAITAAL
jgi:hypothetical protein